MIFLAAFVIAPVLAAPSAASLDPVSAIDKRDNDFSSICSVNLYPICLEDLPSDPTTFFEADPFRRGALEWCAEMKKILGRYGRILLHRTANMSAINGENIEHDVERDFEIHVKIEDEAKDVKDNEAVYGICVRGIQNLGSKGLGCTKEVKGTTEVKGGLARLEYENVMVRSVQLVYS